MSFERFLSGLDARVVDEKYAAIYEGGGDEDDRSDEAFAALLLAVRDEALGTSSGRSEAFDEHRFRDCLASGAESEIDYAMDVPPETFLARRALVRDVIEGVGDEEPKALMRELLEGFEEDPDE